MSRKTTPRTLKLKRKPGGFAKWKVTFNYNVNPTRIFNRRFLASYVKHRISAIEEAIAIMVPLFSSKFKFERTSRYSEPIHTAVYLEDFADVLILKMMYSELIRNIYEIEIVGED